ncbi:MAG: hypothetical protein PHC34_01515 [Candidatus Gastranaerophilales bacterium]|nr:hypothetical protein [Candidatus Gastranaerophilales bacterium]
MKNKTNQKIEKYEDLPDWAKKMVDAQLKFDALPEEEKEIIKKKFENLRAKMES